MEQVGSIEDGDSHGIQSAPVTGIPKLDEKLREWFEWDKVRLIT